MIIDQKLFLHLNRCIDIGMDLVWWCLIMLPNPHCEVFFFCLFVFFLTIGYFDLLDLIVVVVLKMKDIW